jgi:hypothetical protein
MIEAAVEQPEAQVGWLHPSTARRSRADNDEVRYRQAVDHNPRDAVAHNNLGWALQMRGDSAGAVANYRLAYDLDPSLTTARRNLATLLVTLGRPAESFALWHEEISSGESGREWIETLVSNAMHQNDLTLAGEYATLLAQLRWGTPWYPKDSGDPPLPLPVDPPQLFLTIPKLRHDIEQFQYLQERNLIGNDFSDVIREYERVIEALSSRGTEARIPLDPVEHQAIVQVYNRISHLARVPRISGSPWGDWDPRDVEQQYLDRPLGLVIVDNFLSEEALEGVRQFCLESTIWSANRYAHGRLGSFFHDGFTTPLLLQLAEELRRVMPRVIIDRYPLRQMWGFKNGEFLPAGSTVHADFAAVNVNFWITPDDANLDPESGGLIVYDVDAPLSWDFATYNGRPDLIKPFLEQQHAKKITIPYRANRAIIFNSDLFHASAGLRFKPGYQNRRINVTMLYGNREGDVHHREISRADGPDGAGAWAGAWRSAAFRTARG